MFKFKPTQFGLIVPEKKKQEVKSVFDTNDQLTSKEEREKRIMREELANQKRLALNDASVSAQSVNLEDEYDYDKYLDEKIAVEEAEKKLKTYEKPKSKYIHLLKKRADERNRENEIIYEKQIQKEREEEGEEFAGKEQYITTGYKKKLQEQKKWLAEQAVKDKKDEETSAKTVGNMSDYYMNFMTKNISVMGEEEDIKKHHEELLKKIKIEEEKKKFLNENNTKEMNSFKEEEEGNFLMDPSLKSKEGSSKENKEQREKSHDSNDDKNEDENNYGFLMDPERMKKPVSSSTPSKSSSSNKHNTSSSKHRDTHNHSYNHHHSSERRSRSRSHNHSYQHTSPSSSSSTYHQSHGDSRHRYHESRHSNRSHSRDRSNHHTHRH
ncbi:hypothetical protein WA158_005762 [Blastocystis sp. Blastoise]